MRIFLILSYLTLINADIEMQVMETAPGSNQQPLLREAGVGVELVGDDHDDEDSEEHNEVLVVDVPLVEGGEDVRCVAKVMMVEETEWDEVVTCNHSYHQSCHQSYVTR